MSDLGSVVFSGNDNAGAQIGYNYGNIVNNFGKTDNNLLLQGNSVVYSRKKLQPVKHYVDRTALASKLRDQLDRNGGSEGSNGCIAVVYGLGGAGKSQLVLRYVQQFRSEYSAIFWVMAENKETIGRDFTQIYRYVFNKLDVGKDELPKDEDLILAVRAWIGQRSGRRLLVLDGADNVVNETDENTLSLQDFLPDGPNIDIIVTTRTPSVKDLATMDAIEVDKLEPTESVELFCRSAKVRKQLQNPIISQITEELGHLALAITLAGHYISETPRLASNLELYLQEYRAERNTLLDRKPSKLIHQYGKSMVTTWEASMVAVSLRSASAARLLNLLAFLNFEDFFSSLFCSETRSTDSLASNEGLEVGDWRQLIQKDSELRVRDIEGMINTLEDYSLIQRMHESSDSSKELKSEQFTFLESKPLLMPMDGYQAHKLVHAWAYERLSISDRIAFGIAALQVIGEAINKSKQDLTTRLRLVPHVSKIIEVLSSMGSIEEKNAEVMGIRMRPLSSFLSSMGKYRDFENSTRLQFEWFTSSKGRDDTNTMIAARYLVRSLTDVGKYEEAWTLSEDVLERRRRIFGADHPDTIDTKHGQAILLNMKGLTRDALNLQHEVVRSYQLIYGKQHGSTLLALGNLATYLIEDGKYIDAKAIQNEVLEAYTTMYGAEDLDTLTVMSNFAMTHHKLGLFQDAAELNDRVISVRRRALGDDHPDTLTSISNSGLYMLDAGHYAEAAKRYREVFEHSCDSLGTKHPETLEVMNSLATAIALSGDFATAYPLHQQLIQLSKEVLGHDSPSHLTYLANLAGTLVSLGRFQEAELMFRDVLQTRERVQHADHPDVALALHDLAHVLDDLGRSAEALDLATISLEKRKAVLGAEHPSTLITMGNVSTFLARLGRTKEAIALEKEVLALHKRVLGNDHPHTITAESNLAFSLCETGDIEEGLQMREVLVQKLKSLKGEDSQETLVAISNFANALEKVGQMNRAAKIRQQLIGKFEEKLGPNDRMTVQCMHSLAHNLGIQNQVSEAETIQRAVLKRKQASLGKANDSTILAAIQLSQYLDGQQKLDEAKCVLEQALSDGRKELGDFHGHILDIKRMLIDILWRQGNKTEAKGMKCEFYRLTEDCSRWNTKPALVATINAALLFRDHRDDPQQVKKLLEGTIDRMRQVLPEGDEDLATSIGNLACIQIENKQYDKSVALLQEYIEMGSKLWGERWDKLGWANKCLAEALLELRQHEAAEATRRRHLQMAINALGPQDHATLTSMSDLAINLSRHWGKTDEAEHLQAEVVKRGNETLGSAHPCVQIWLRDLAKMLLRHRNYSESEIRARQLLDIQEKHSASVEDVAQTEQLLKDILVAQAKASDTEDSELELAMAQASIR